MPFFGSGDEKAQEAEAAAAVRALSVEALAADVLEQVFGGRSADIMARSAFNEYKKARGADLTAEDHPVFAEAFQHLMNHRAIALDCFFRGDSLVFILTRRGRELLDRGEHVAALADPAR